LPYEENCGHKTQNQDDTPARDETASEKLLCAFSLLMPRHTPFPWSKELVPLALLSCEQISFIGSDCIETEKAA
jgi:hypothetical protein